MTKRTSLFGYIQGSGERPSKSQVECAKGFLDGSLFQDELRTRLYPVVAWDIAREIVREFERHLARDHTVPPLTVGDACPSGRPYPHTWDAQCEAASFVLPGGESAAARLRQVMADLAASQTDLTKALDDRDKLATAVAGWVARWHAAYEALYIEEFDGDSCPDLETTIEYAVQAYRRVCESEASAAVQIDLLRAELAAESRKVAQLQALLAEAARQRDLNIAEVATASKEVKALRAARQWIVARDGGRYCERCEQEIRRGEAYEEQPGTGGLAAHIHCPDNRPGADRA